MVVDNYARRLTRYCDVTVFAPEIGDGSDYRDDFPYKVVRCHALPLGRREYDLPLPDLDREFRQTLEHQELDLVHIHSPFTVGRMGLRYAREHRIPVVATMHSQYRQDFKRELKLDWISDLATREMVTVFDRCDECWAVNRSVAEIFYRDYGCREMPKVQDNATDMLPVADPDAVRREVRAKYGVSGEEKLLLFVGRLTNLKNLPFLADALAILHRRGVAFRMLFVGDGPDAEELAEKLRTLHLTSCVTLCGRLTDRQEIARLYAAGDLFLFPSLYDASSLVQIEAASQHLPAVFLKGAATAAGIADGHNGFLSDASPEAFAETVERALTSGVLESVRENCFRELYRSFDDVVAQVYARYAELIRNPPPPKKWIGGLL